LKKTRLQIEYDYDFSLLGVVTNVKEYKLAWYINQVLQINLTKQEEIIIPKLDARNLVISNLLHESDYSSIRLIGNRSLEDDSNVKSTLLPELQNFTHFLLLHDEQGAFDEKTLIDQIKSIDVVEYVVAIDPDRLKNKDNLIF